MNKKFVVNALIALVMLLASLWSGLAPSAQAQAQGGLEFRISVNATAHARYHLFYPATYVFGLPAGASNLQAYYRYTADGDWLSLPTRQAGEVFNGVHAARFDYAAARAYLSVSFASTSHDIFVQVRDQSGTPVGMQYLDIARYYDNRRAAVTITLDDWAAYMFQSIYDATVVLEGLHLYHTVSVITGGQEYWAHLQSRVNTGYTEVAAHTRSHPCPPYTPYGNYSEEIGGSRDDLLAYLQLNPEYVPAFSQPCGYEDTAVRQAVVDAEFIADRGYATVTGLGPIDFAPWSADGAYASVLPTYIVYIWEGRWDGGGSAEDLAEANAAFDYAYSNNGIYHLTDHPDANIWRVGGYMRQHLSYIANRADVWYVPFGRLYLYHYIEERDQVSATVIVPTAVEVSGFKAKPVGGAISVGWETTNEIDTLGFNLYRSAAVEGPYTRLNDSLIPSQAPGSPLGAVYTWLDSNVEPGGTYYYKLEALDFYGQASLYGPAWATSSYLLYLPLVRR